MPTYRHRTRLPHGPDLVYRWHTRPAALHRLLPPWVSARVLERTGGLEEGAHVRIRVRHGPLPVEWLVEHTAVDDGRGFRDEQLKGPFRRWIHTHRFLPAEDGGCVVEDEVEWEPPLGGLVGSIASPLVERELPRVFAFRHRRLAHDLRRLRGYPSRGSLRVAVTGASGLLGGLLTDFLRAGGHRVVRLVRSREAAREPDAAYWSAASGEVETESLEGLDAVVHFAGESIFGLRWTPAKKEAILESRRRGTRVLTEALAGLDAPPEVLVSASGVDYYGGGGAETVTEESPGGDGFLARVCRAWEGATAPAADAGIRVVTLRSGLVLTPEGGALDAMLPAFRMGLGGRIGGGRQYLSWIDADDHVGLVHHAIRRTDLTGALNAVAPNPVTNGAFADALGRVLRRPTILPLPATVVKAALGQMGRELLLEGRRVVPEKALRTDFDFSRPGLEDSLRHQLGRNGAAA